MVNSRIPINQPCNSVFQMQFGTGAGISYQMETLVKRGIISPRVREQMLDTLTVSTTVGLKGLSHQNSFQSMSRSIQQEPSSVRPHHDDLVSQPVH